MVDLVDTFRDVGLAVRGNTYSGWKSIRVTRTIEGLAGSFALEASDRWGADAPWPILEGDECRVTIGDQVVIDGYLDKRDLSASKDSRSLAYSGRDRAADLVDCSLLVADGASTSKSHKWTYRNLDIAQFAAAVAAPHGIRVSVQPGLVLKKDPSLVAHPGETGFEALQRAAGSAGVLVVSDGAGGILITRAGTSRAAPLVEGSILDAKATKDASNRFRTYLISSQPPGTDEAYGESLRVLASATDAEVTRANRILLIRPDKGYHAADARQRAGWEARIRAAKATTASITVQGWKQPNGALWPVNAITRVSARNLIDVDEDMLISQVEYSVSDGGRITQLQLIRPDALMPEPQVVTSAGAEGGWPELAKGAL